MGYSFNSMFDLIEKYVDKFHENFPMFMVMGLDDTEIEAIIQNCLDTGVPYQPSDSDGERLY